MRDGVVLRCDVYRPDDGEHHPVLLQRTPYDKSASLLVAAYPQLEPLRAAERGYAVVVQDVRGRFRSDGGFDPFRTEADDGHDTLDWIIAQPFADGRVTMWGQSYYGATALLAVADGHPAVRAVVTSLTAGDVHDGWIYRGGAFQLGFALLWTAKDLAFLDGVVADIDAAYEQLPLAGSVAGRAPYYAEWLDHPDDDGFWTALAADEQYRDPTVAGLHIGGWYDIFLDGTLRTYEAFVALGGAPQHLVIGPWSHGNLGDTVGDVGFGPASSLAAALPTDRQLDLLDAFLRGEPADEPAVRLFVTGADEWRAFDRWPPADSRPTDLFLRSDAALTPDAPAVDEPERTWRADPGDPVPSVAGGTFLPGGAVSRFSGPRDREPLTRRPDVLTYRTGELLGDCELIGEVGATLTFASSAEDTDLTVTLVDVAPDGSHRHVTDGVLRLSARRPGARTPLEPDEYVRVTVAMSATAHRFRAGHALGLLVASSEFPRYDRHPNRFLASGAVRSTADFVVADQRLAHPSRVSVPVHGAAPEFAPTQTRSVRYEKAAR